MTVSASPSPAVQVLKRALEDHRAEVQRIRALLQYEQQLVEQIALFINDVILAESRASALEAKAAAWVAVPPEPEPCGPPAKEESYTTYARAQAVLDPTNF